MTCSTMSIWQIGLLVLVPWAAFAVGLCWGKKP
jgi:hypothetical protein